VRPQRGLIQRLKKGCEAVRGQIDALHAVCRESGDYLILELFAGTARLTKMAAARKGWSAMDPVEVQLGCDVREKQVRKDILALIRAKQPDLITISPPCGPWCQFQRLAKDVHQVLMKQEEDLVFWHFTAEVWSEQNKHGRLVLTEQPWQSEALKLTFMEERKDLHRAKISQCALGLVDVASGRPHWKLTALDVNDPLMKDYMEPRALCRHAPGEHQTVEGHVYWQGGWWKRSTLAARWPSGLCELILEAAEHVWRVRKEQQQPLRSLAMPGAAGEHYALPVEPTPTVEGEVRRQLGKADWTGNQYDYIYFEGEVSGNRVTKFGEKILSDSFYVWDIEGVRYNVTHILDSLTEYHMGIVSQNPSAEVTAELLQNRWCGVFGPPELLQTDAGKEYEDVVQRISRLLDFRHEVEEEPLPLAAPEVPMMIEDQPKRNTTEEVVPPEEGEQRAQKIRRMELLNDLPISIRQHLGSTGPSSAVAPAMPPPPSEAAAAMAPVPEDLESDEGMDGQSQGVASQSPFEMNVKEKVKMFDDWAQNRRSRPTTLNEAQLRSQLEKAASKVRDIRKVIQKSRVAQHRRVKGPRSERRGSELMVLEVEADDFEEVWREACSQHQLQESFWTQPTVEAEALKEIQEKLVSEQEEHKQAGAAAEIVTGKAMPSLLFFLLAGPSLVGVEASATSAGLAPHTGDRGHRESGGRSEKRAAGAAANPAYYFGASGVSALAFFPLWKAAAIGQSGYKAVRRGLLDMSKLWHQVEGSGYWQKYFEAMKPPWRGVAPAAAVTATESRVGGMTWARAAIFYGSDTGSKWMRKEGYSTALASTVPSLLVSCFAQAVNQPFVRSSIMLQKPGEELAKATFPNMTMLRHLAHTKGFGSWFTGLDAAILKTAPKYMTAVLIKDYMGLWLAPVDPKDKQAVLLKSAKISVTAGVAGAVLTNPLDVVRNEMFKTEEGMVACMMRMSKEDGNLSGPMWLLRGIGKNWVAVAAPIASTIFLTDRFKVWFGGA
ncbi:unnamed protein product, partial [Durusdinium trenchii]